MSTFTAPLGIEPAAEWRELDTSIARWVLAHGGSPLLARTAAWATLAESHGDTAVALAGEGPGRHGMPVLDTDAIAALEREPMVGDGCSATPTPFVIERGLFYLWRMHAQEVAVARMIRERRRTGQPAPLDEATVDALFHGDRGAPVLAQRRAVQQAPGRRLFVLTGGPGTGKTTTVLRMLLGMLHQAGGAEPTVRIAAPTGKAAQRLAQALRDGKQRLQGHDTEMPAHLQALLARIPDDEPLTLHRLLGVDGRSQRFRHHADDPLAADIVVVDEASMVDLALLRGLLAALRPEASLILVGDPDQLSAVGAGAVLADLVDALRREGADDLVELTHSFRAGDSLQPVLVAIRDGDVPAFDAAWEAGGDQVRHVAVSDSRSLDIAVRRWADQLRALWRHHDLTRPTDAGHPAADAAQRLQLVRERQLLCALREGEFGARAVNQRIEDQLRAHAGRASVEAWYPGRLVMVTRNDYSAGLFNGDVGLCLCDDSGRLWVWFEYTDADRMASARPFAPTLVPTHVGAFAITVHKSQGSEYGEVGLVLAPGARSGFVSRQLLYTAVSRSRTRVEAWTDRASVVAAVAGESSRTSGLGGRL
ncbi:exodeoxyribonuclease V subunit alpha [Alkalisalibacterium limincola]|uniref:RecBCD enzyme subunit RecD n=1 Tax=Alkalisalibacterium limincola TaxID=2699169 RepID=A0A5C8KNG9_9GAMM|nr:exodeoxyribonuclease V subunit alpha [Alkalisalibacterium limincola]TXK60962.1 exodeoxyribonuclease V subunit alpha [Alkalisalibacterium limincola]